MLVLVVGVPLVVLGQESVSGELGWGVYAEVWNSPATRTVLLRTLTTAALVSLVCLLLAYPYAFAHDGLRLAPAGRAPGACPVAV